MLLRKMQAMKTATEENKQKKKHIASKNGLNVEQTFRADLFLSLSCNWRRKLCQATALNDHYA